MTAMDRRDLTFYDYPWGEPTQAVVEYAGQFYDIRESWGCAEGWTNDYAALPVSDEDVERYGNDLTEMTLREIRAVYGAEILEGISRAVKEKENNGRTTATHLE